MGWIGIPLDGCDTISSFLTQLPHVTKRREERQRKKRGGERRGKRRVREIRDERWGRGKRRDRGEMGVELCVGMRVDVLFNFLERASVQAMIEIMILDRYCYELAERALSSIP